MTELKRRIRKWWWVPTLLLFASVGGGYLLIERERVAEQRMEEFRQDPDTIFAMDYIPPAWAKLSWTKATFEYLPEEFQHAFSTRHVLIEINSDAEMERLFTIFDPQEVKVLDLVGEGVTVNSLKYFDKMAGLESLTIDCANLTDDDLRYLTALDDLHTLFLAGNDQLQGSGLKHVVAIKKLQFAVLINNIDRESVWGLLVDSPQLKVDCSRLKSKPFVMRDEHLAKLSRDVSESNFPIARFEISDKYLDRLQYLPSTTEIDLRHSTITDQGVAEFAKWSDIEEIDLTGNPVTDKAVEILAQEPNLRRLILDDTAITDRAIELIMNSKLRDQLVRLSLNNTKISAEKACELSKIKNLYSLGLIDTAADDSLLEAVKDCPCLGIVFINRENITPEKIAELRRGFPPLRIRYQRPIY
ncbi:MAG: hypothetical protein KDA65_00925 [Planctomycetaceae bacterium]|nr:hypothetical protein [Planctomycetaceae bacterium]